MPAEGFMWHHRWTPPEMWTEAHTSQVSHAKLSLELVADKIFQANRLEAAAPDIGALGTSKTGVAANGCRVVESVLCTSGFVSRAGEVIQSSKLLRIQTSDGVHEPSAIIVSYKIPHAIQMWKEKEAALQAKRHALPEEQRQRFDRAYPSVPSATATGGVFRMFAPPPAYVYYHRT
jgi:hypothetical protein